MSRNFGENHRVVVAMSGGVDSSAAAAVLKEQGYDPIGITLNLSCSARSADKGCCSASAAADARKVAHQLGFPHYTLNFKEKFKKLVIDNFVEEYQNGRTPNPCIRCNQFIKFDLLLKKARELGAEHVATGHYARIMTNVSRKAGSRIKDTNMESGQCPMSNEGKYKLLKGVDGRKDQSYVLYMLTQESLAHILFPLGGATKAEVRKIARNLKLPVAEKKESQEICFIEDDDYGRFLKETSLEAVKPGLILDRQGNKVGMHAGIAFYTIGQRKGIGAHGGKPKYVVEIFRDKNAIVIGDEKDLFRDELTAEEVSFVSGSRPTGPLEVTAKIRYNSPGAKAIIRWLGGLVVRVKFEKPQRAITPGQAVVFYAGEEVLGGGVIRG
ncbi:tRNA 2-thiouridine(34) synthase MnmA [Candidatus Saganbacteria bacterium]|uniref:tRNA-specific 2-thiouridylase MnmA n=1 Tax=Candidatus Saganbacteria bacterium TaxID=2575572 RepID=A0A9D6ULP3_UNCSA|nr:tRNA 2-thiouridine(34) synthase MnmA [Candidatus Saganbacteria bacterium]